MPRRVLSTGGARDNHGDVLNEYWPRLTQERPDFPFHLVGDEDEILARARCIPLR